MEDVVDDALRFCAAVTRAAEGVAEGDEGFVELAAVAPGVALVELGDFRAEVVGFEPADGPLPRVFGAFFAGKAGDEVGDFVRAVIARL